MKPIHRPAALTPAAVPEQNRLAETLGKIAGQAAGERELRLVSGDVAAIRPQLQSLLAGIGLAQSLPGRLVEPWQDDLQQAHLPGDQLDRLIDV
jgi:hypothetical protein